MNAYVDQEAVSTASSNNTKMSMFKGKAGFVIPKNKFSGSLVPIFKGGKKSESCDAPTEENSKQLQRKTKWGPDLTQDISVRRGRALAYQTRVDQISQQLKLGSLSNDGQNAEVAGYVQDSEPTTDIDYEKLKTLELERREAIGEILKLNPNYKAPSDYEPVSREAAVPIPVREHPGFNFVGLLYGPDGDTHKRLEKETGTKMQVYGVKKETGEKVEITASDGIEVLSNCDELYVRIAADTYEKVDAAASLLELLLSSVPGKSAASKASAAVSEDDMQVPIEGQDLTTASAVGTAVASQELVRANFLPIPTSSQGPFQRIQGSWFPTSLSNMPSGFGPVHSSMAFPFNSSTTHAMFPPRPTAAYGFGSSPQNIQPGPPRSHSPVQVMQAPLMPPANPFGQSVPPRNLPVAMSPSPLMGHQTIAAGSPNVPRAQLTERPLNPAGNSAGRPMPPIGAPQSVLPHSAGASLNPPSITPQPFPSQVRPTSATSFVPSQMQSSSAMPMPVQSFTPQNPPMNTVLRPGQVPAPPPPSRSQSGMPGPGVGPLNVPSFTALKPMGGGPMPRPLLSGSNDFTFLPQRCAQPVSGPNVHFASQRPPGPPPGQLPPPPQAPSFRPALQNTMPQHPGQNFPRPPMGPHPGQFGPSNPNPHMAPRNVGPGPQMAGAAGPFPPPRMGQSPQYQQSYPAPPMGQAGCPFNRGQVYDPFSPASAASAQGNNISVTRKQDSDPEYEDLMASVGVK